MSAVFNYLGLVGAFLSAVLLFPALIAFGSGETENGISLVLYAALGSFLSITLLVATGHTAMLLDRRTSILLAVGGWILFPLLLAFPISGMFSIDYGAALFEAVSALTTTAADGVGRLEAQPAAAIALRAAIQWAGGLGTILTFLILLGPTSIGGLPKTRRSVGEASGRIATGIHRMAGSLTRYYSAATIFCFVLLMMTGIEPFAAIILSFTALSAGGYLPSDGELFELGNSAALVVISFFFIVAATSVYWHRMVGRWQIENLKRHRESYYLIGSVAVVTALLTVTFATTPGMINSTGPLGLAAEALFNAASLVSTSGLQSSNGVFTLLSPAFVFFVLLVGGGCYSAAGGIKYYRVGAMLFHARHDLSRLIYPHAVAPMRFGTEQYDLGVMKSIWSMFMAAALVLVAGSVLLALMGLDYQASITATIAAFVNAGPAYSDAWAPRGTEGWIAYHDMAIGMKLALAAIMLIGHLEVIAVVVALDPRRILFR
ncbi:MAG: TrkH family potassium uptake protein [Nitratireductor sp.]|nr:TrkH family potassium uptake protein [Nitratireductor sp.]